MRRHAHPAAALLLAAALFAGVAGVAGVACYNRKDYQAPTDPAKAFIILTAAAGPGCTPPAGAAACLPADGLSTLLLTARIAGDSTSRLIDFTTTAGTFAGAAGAGTSTEVPIDSTGATTVQLISARMVGTAVITAQVKDKPQVAASLVLAFTAPDQNAILQSLTVPATAPADGASASLIVAVVSSNLGSANRTVTFSTTAGSFTLGAQNLTAMVTAGADGKASTLLYSPNAAGAAVVTASVFQNSQQAAITFVPALPDSILVQITPASVPDTAGATVTITAQLVRAIGTVIPNTVANFVVRDGNNVPFGTFTSVQASNATGVATAVFSPGGTGHTGQATVTVSVAGSSAVGKGSFNVAPAS